MTKKKPSLDKKVPFNISVRAGIKLSFIRQCEEDNVNHNDMIEVLMEEYLQQRYYDEKYSKSIEE